MSTASDPADFYTGLVAELYRHLRGEVPDPEPYARFVAGSGEPALELGCGDGDPLLDLRERGLDVEGLDSSADMLDRCRAAAAARGVDVVLHHARFDTMRLGRRYRSIYLAGATFNLLPDDAAMEQALVAIAQHLEPGGAALVPLFVPDAAAAGAVGTTKEHATPDGTVMRVSVMGVERDEAARTQVTTLRYELQRNGRIDTADRRWTLHWVPREPFAAMADRAGLDVRAVFAPDGGTAAPEATSFVFLLARPA